MKTENGKLLKTLTAEYTVYSDFNLQEILNEYNEQNKTNYKLEDIEDYYIKYNTLYLTMNDDIEIEYEGIIGEIDYKRPDNILENNFV